MDPRSLWRKIKGLNILIMAGLFQYILVDYQWITYQWIIFMSLFWHHFAKLCFSKILERLCFWHVTFQAMLCGGSPRVTREPLVLQDPVEKRGTVVILETVVEVATTMLLTIMESGWLKQTTPMLLWKWLTTYAVSELDFFLILQNEFEFCITVSFVNELNPRFSHQVRVYYRK